MHSKQHNFRNVTWVSFWSRQHQEPNCRNMNPVPFQRHIHQNGIAQNEILDNQTNMLSMCGFVSWLTPLPSPLSLSSYNNSWNRLIVQNSWLLMQESCMDCALCVSAVQYLITYCIHLTITDTVLIRFSGHSVLGNGISEPLFSNKRTIPSEIHIIYGFIYFLLFYFFFTIISISNSWRIFWAALKHRHSI